MTEQYAPEHLAAQGASATEVDTSQLLAAMKAMQERLDALEAEKRSRNAPALVSTAESLRDLIIKHASGMTVHGQVPDMSQGTRLADDVVDAAGNAVTSGDVSHVRAIGQRIETWLRRIHPGPQDHPYYSQAVDFASHHLPLAADQVTGPQPSGALPVSGAAPVSVIPGSVTG